MQVKRVLNGFAILMLVGSAPWALAIAIFVQIMIAHEEGKSSGGNALGLMMMSLSAYGVALVSCFAGLVYFVYAAIGKSTFPEIWHWLTIGYSILLLVIPVIYLILQ